MCCHTEENGQNNDDGGSSAVYIPFVEASGYQIDPGTEAKWFVLD